ncbi:MAG: DUF507 family protein [Candidatus Binatia bacterium]
MKGEGFTISPGYPQGLLILSTAFPQPMKIKPEQIDRLVDRLLKNYRTKDMIVLKTNEATVRAKIVEIITKNFRDEEAIEDEARKILAAHASEARDADQHKMFLMIKQKLAQTKGFVL